MRRAVVVLSSLVLGLLAIPYFRTRWNRGDEVPQVADAINQGRRAAFVVFTGGAKTDGSRPIWSAATEERVKSLTQLMVLPSELGDDLADELGPNFPVGAMFRLGSCLRGERG